jgi:glycosyltransferase involved in cell wall biosynthesis
MIPGHPATEAGSRSSRTVLFVDNYRGPGLGGGEVVLKNLTLGLAAADWAVHVVGPADADWLVELESAGAHRHEVDFAPGRWRALERELKAIIRDVAPDVVHTHGFFPGLVGRRAALAAGACAVVNTVHCEPASIMTVKTGVSARVELLLRRWLDRRLARRTDAIVAVSEAVALALETGGIPRGKITVIHSGIEMPAQACPSSPPTHDPPVVGAVCRLDPVKGLDDLIAAAAILREKKVNARVQMHGEGPAKGVLEALIAKHSLQETVALAGAMADRDALFAGLDVCVSASRSEGLNLSLIDAMARGVPVVATDVGGQLEVVDRGRVGLLVPPRDPATLAEAIEQLLYDASLRARLSAQGCRFARERFSANVMVWRHRELYESLGALRPQADADTPRDS